MATTERRQRPNKEQAVEQETQIYSMSRRGLTADHIGRQLGVPPAAVEATLRRVNTRVLAGMENIVEADRAGQLHLLDHIADEAMRAWERSKDPSSFGRCGDAAFLDQARAALAAKRRLEGLEL